ncbi:MAG: hypothetical protein ABW061_22810 [Polyangiaceae bacterium]
MTVGVLGIGGLGHLGLKLARAMGAHVVAFTEAQRDLVLGGIPDRMEYSPALLAMGWRSIASSGTGGRLETQEMLEFCKQEAIVPD